MNTTAREKINDLQNGKVVRIYKDGWLYKFGAMDTMADIVMIPTKEENESEIIEDIKMTGNCTITEAEELIERICK